MSAAWPFADPPDVATITIKYAIEDAYPILLVTHDADDGAWQILCGTTDDPADARLVSLSSMYSVTHPLAHLQPCHLAGVRGAKARRPRGFAHQTCAMKMTDAVLVPITTTSTSRPPHGWELKRRLDLERRHGMISKSLFNDKGDRNV